MSRPGSITGRASGRPAQQGQALLHAGAVHLGEVTADEHPLRHGRQRPHPHRGVEGEAVRRQRAGGGVEGDHPLAEDVAVVARRLPAVATGVAVATVRGVVEPPVGLEARLEASVAPGPPEQAGRVAGRAEVDRVPLVDVVRAGVAGVERGLLRVEVDLGDPLSAELPALGLDPGELARRAGPGRAVDDEDAAVDRLAVGRRERAGEVDLAGVRADREALDHAATLERAVRPEGVDDEGGIDLAGHAVELDEVGARGAAHPLEDAADVERAARELRDDRGVVGLGLEGRVDGAGRQVERGDPVAGDATDGLEAADGIQPALVRGHLEVEDDVVGIGPEARVTGSGRGVERGDAAADEPPDAGEAAADEGAGRARRDREDLAGRDRVPARRRGAAHGEGREVVPLDGPRLAEPAADVDHAVPLAQGVDLGDAGHHGVGVLRAVRLVAAVEPGVESGHGAVGADLGQGGAELAGDAREVAADVDGAGPGVSGHGADDPVGRGGPGRGRPGGGLEGDEVAARGRAGGAEGAAGIEPGAVPRERNAADRPVRRRPEARVDGAGLAREADDPVGHRGADGGEVAGGVDTGGVRHERAHRAVGGGAPRRDDVAAVAVDGDEPADGRLRLVDVGDAAAEDHLVGEHRDGVDDTPGLGAPGGDLTGGSDLRGSGSELPGHPLEVADDVEAALAVGRARGDEPVDERRGGEDAAPVAVHGDAVAGLGADVVEGPCEVGAVAHDLDVRDATVGPPPGRVRAGLEGGGPGDERRSFHRTSGQDLHDPRQHQRRGGDDANAPTCFHVFPVTSRVHRSRHGCDGPSPAPPGAGPTFVPTGFLHPQSCSVPAGSVRPQSCSSPAGVARDLLGLAHHLGQGAGRTGARTPCGGDRRQGVRPPGRGALDGGRDLGRRHGLGRVRNAGEGLLESRLRGGGRRDALLQLGKVGIQPGGHRRDLAPRRRPGRGDRPHALGVEGHGAAATGLGRVGRRALPLDGVPGAGRGGGQQGPERGERVVRLHLLHGVDEGEEGRRHPVVRRGDAGDPRVRRRRGGRRRDGGRRGRRCCRCRRRRADDRAGRARGGRLGRGRGGAGGDPDDHRCDEQRRRGAERAARGPDPGGVARHRSASLAAAGAGRLARVRPEAAGETTER